MRRRAPREARRALEDLRDVPSAVPAGGTVPLASVAWIGHRLGPVDVERANQGRLAKVELTPAEGVDLGTHTCLVEARIDRVGVPAGM